MKIKRIIDISRSMYPGMAVWPGDDTVEIHTVENSDSEGKVHISSMKAGLHSGTHIDAPFHFVDGGITISELDLSRFIGRAKVFALDVKTCIYAEDIKNLPIQEGDIVFFKTSNSALPESGEFHKNFVHLEVSAAEYLADKKVKTVGVDYLSVGGYGKASGSRVHRILLSNCIGVIECLCLKAVDTGSYFFCALPLKIEGVDGSPTRAVLMEVE